MGILGRITALSLVCALAGAGCSSRKAERGVTGQRISAKALPPKAQTAAPVVSPYDEHGNLKPSEQRIGWLELPMGLSERPSSQGSHHAYVASVPLGALTKFFDSRVFTSKVRVDGNGVRYGSAQPKNLDPKAITLEIALYANRRGDTVQLIIDEHTVNAAGPMSLEAAQALLKEKQARAE